MSVGPGVVVLLGLVVVCASCATELISAGGGDGVLDCEDNQVVVGAEIVTRGDTEEAVVNEALSAWLADGATLISLPLDESWSATLDGRDAALAYPELEGDGGWIVHDVRTCGEPATGPAALDGSLDCANDSSWSEQASFAPDAMGLPSAEAALRASLDPFNERFGGRVEFVDAAVAFLVIDEREQVIALTSEAPAGSWLVDTVLGCDGFQR